jgi:hypothetical protein
MLMPPTKVSAAQLRQFTSKEQQRLDEQNEYERTWQSITGSAQRVSYGIGRSLL